MATEKKQITRNRTSYSCQTCRRRKIKCDKLHPICSGCQKAGEECVYGDTDKPANQPSAVVLPTREDDARKRRAVDHDHTHDDVTPSPGFKAIEERLEQITMLVQDVNRLTPSSNDDSPRSSQYANGGAETLSATRNTRDGSHTQSVSHSSPNTTLNDHRTPWANLLGKLDQLNSLLKTGLKNKSTQPYDRPLGDDRPFGPPKSARIVEDNASYDRPMTAILPTANSLSMAHLSDNDVLAPTEAESNVLFRSWLFSIHPICPIFPPRLVLEKYESFNQWYRHGMDKGEQNPDPSFMPYLTLIWYTGYINLSDRARKRWFAWAKNNPLWVHTLRARLEHKLKVMRSEVAPSIWALAAAIIGQHLAIEGQDIVSNSLSNTLNIRAAQGLGLHSERALKDLNASQAETKRRLWWEAISLDTAISAVSGMPVVLDEMYSDTKMISELKDVVVGTKEADDYQKHLEEAEAEVDRPDDPTNCQTSSLVSVYHLAMNARHMLTATTKKVLKANMSAQPMTMDELKELRKLLLKTSKDVHAIINRIPCRGVPELDFVPETLGATADFDHIDSMGMPVTELEIGSFLREHSNGQGLAAVTMYHRTTTVAFHKWARTTLSMLVDRLDCISYAPFLKNSKSRMWAVARNCALKACHGYMRKFLSLAENPELRRFRWAWSGTLQPMHATIIMLIDLHDRPHSDEAPRSRTMIDKLFSLASPGKGLVNKKFTTIPLKEGGNEAWTMLRKLRYNAWQKAGLDPDVLWSEDDQMSVGVGKPLTENDLFIRSLREDIISGHKKMQSRHDDGRSFDADHQRVSNGVAAHNARKQYLHPSELGPGDRVDGPVTRNLVDLDIDPDLPHILLLRASHQQELMPYPLDDIRTQSVIPEQETSVTGGTSQQTGPSPGTEGAEIFHIGELIKRIRESQPPKLANAEAPASTKNDTYYAQDLPGKEACNFRSLREVEKTAFQEILERNSASGIPSIDENRKVVPAFETHSDSEFPFASLPRKTASDMNNHLTAAPQQGPLANTPMNMLMTNSFGYLGMTWPQMSFVARPQAQQPAQAKSPPNPSAMVKNSQTEYLRGPDLNMSSITEVDFDWDKWDETFGQYGGFEDMLLDDSDTMEHGEWAHDMHEMQ